MKLYERDCFRCYRKINARGSCDGQSSYNAETVNEVVLREVRRILAQVKMIPEAALLAKARESHDDVNAVAYKQAEQDFFEAHRQITALEDQAMKYLTGENSLDIAIVNAMMPKYKEKLHNAQIRMDEARRKLDEEMETSKAAAQEVSDLISWADTFDQASVGTKHMIIARLIERIDVGRNYDIQIKFRISVEQYTGIAA